MRYICFVIPDPVILFLSEGLSFDFLLCVPLQAFDILVVLCVYNQISGFRERSRMSVEGSMSHRAFHGLMFSSSSSFSHPRSNEHVSGIYGSNVAKQFESMRAGVFIEREVMG
jgi:hypothetical protein